MVREQITQEADGETMTPSNMQRIVTLLARLGAAHGLRQVPLALEDITSLTQDLVLDNALGTLHTDAIIGDFYVDDPQTGRASPLALQPQSQSCRARDDCISTQSSVLSTQSFAGHYG